MTWHSFFQEAFLREKSISYARKSVAYPRYNITVVKGLFQVEVVVCNIPVLSAEYYSAECTGMMQTTLKGGRQYYCL